MESAPKVIEVTIYLKSGQSFTIDVTSFKTKKQGNDLVGVEWASPNDTHDHRYRTIAYIRLDDVSAIVGA